MTPYLYCSGNPVNIVDPDGKDWTRKWRRNSVIVSTTIYGDKKSIKSVGQAVRGWRNRTNDTYTINGKTYKVYYDIRIEETSSIEIMKKAGSNTYMLFDEVRYGEDDEGKKYIITGETNPEKNTIEVYSPYSINKPKSEENSSTGEHEVGHLLGINGHIEGTLMSKSQNEGRTSTLVQSQIDAIIQSTEGHDDFWSFFFKWLNMFLK